MCQDDISEYDEAMKNTIIKQDVMMVLYSNYRDEENMAEFVLHHLFSSFLETHSQDQLLMESFVCHSRGADPLFKTIAKLNKTQYGDYPITRII